MAQHLLTTPRPRWDRLAVLLAVLTSIAALALAMVAVNREVAATPDVRPAVGVTGTPGECAWTYNLREDWIPGIGAEPAC